MVPSRLRVEWELNSTVKRTPTTSRRKNEAAGENEDDDDEQHHCHVVKILILINNSLIHIITMVFLQGFIHRADPGLTGRGMQTESLGHRQRERFDAEGLRHHQCEE